MTSGKRICPLTILTVTALLLGGCGAPAHPAASAPAHRKAGPPPIQFCTVSFNITGLNAVQALGQIHATFEQPNAPASTFTGVAPYSGTDEVICRVPHHPTIAVLTEVPLLQAKAFLGWTLNGDGGRYDNTNVVTPRLSFVVTGNTSVKANYSP